MITKEFDPHSTRKIIFEFNCSKCRKSIKETVAPPKPNLEGDKDTHSDTVNPELYEIECRNCKNIYKVTVSTSIIAGSIYSEDLPDDTVINTGDF